MSNGNGRPASIDEAVRLDVPQILCRRHMAALAPAWPRGYAEAVPRLLELALSVPALIRAADGATGRLADVFDEMPLCGWLPDRLVEEVIAAAIDGAPPMPGNPPVIPITLRIDHQGHVLGPNTDTPDKE